LDERLYLWGHEGPAQLGVPSKVKIDLTVIVACHGAAPKLKLERRKAPWNGADK
jgi:hypothetical protein